MVVVGKSVDLKKMEEVDLEQVRVWRNSKDVSSFMLSQTIITAEQQRKWYEAIRNSAEQLYFIIVSKTGLKLGVVNFNKIDPVTKTAEPGLYIGDTSNRNSFFGMEAYFQLLKFGFEELNLSKVYGTALAVNETAIKMNKSFGYTIESVTRNAIAIDQEMHDVVKLNLLAGDFYKSFMFQFFSKK